MKVTYTLEARDMRAFLAYAQKKLPANRIVRIGGNALLALFSVYWAATTDATGVKHPLLTKVIFAGLVFLLFFLLLKLLNFIVTRLVLWRAYTSEKNRGLICEHTITLTDEALIEATSVNEGKNLWKGIYQIKDDRDYIYVFITHNNAHVIPKRAFSTQEEASRFLQEAKRLHAKAASA